MKKFNSIFVKAVFAIVLLTTGAVVINTNGFNTTQEASAASFEQVYNYLVARGYTVISLQPKPGTKFDWIACTIKDNIRYQTTVYCNATEILGQTDVPL